MTLKKTKMIKTKNSAKEASKKLKAFQKKLTTADRDVTAMSNSKRDLESQRNKLLEQKKTHWRRGDEVEREIKTTVESIKNAERAIFRCPRDIKNALQHVQEHV